MNVADIRRNIADLHARGSVAAARAAGEAALTQHDDAGLRHLVGVIACQMGDPARGAMLLRDAYRAAPSDAIALNLVRALTEIGALDEAATVCAGAERRHPIAGDFTRLHADILARQGQPVAAAARYRTLLRVVPRDPQLWNNFGNALHDAGQPHEAVGALERARDLAPAEPLILLNLARALATAGRFEDQLALLGEATRRAPDDGTILLDYGRALNRAGRADEALPILGTAARMLRNDAQVFVALGSSFTALAQFDRAEQSYRMALHVDPVGADAFVNLGILLEQSNRLTEIDALLDQAEAAGAEMAALSYLVALSLRRKGDHEAALLAVRRADDSVERSLRAQLAGQLLDTLGQHADAFAAFADMNAATAAEPAAAAFTPDAYRHTVEASIALVTPDWVSRWTPAAPRGPRPSPVFLVGFPRSGTTLLDTILMGHPDTVVLEEEPLLQHVAETLSGMAAVADLDTPAIDALRARYFAELDTIHPGIGGRLVIDKLPLNLLRTPLIARLFPDARFIFAKRHPCDVTLSCFMQNFRINQAMASFLTIDGTARLYDAAMTFWERCRAVFDLAIHDIRYEDMVADLEGELRPLLAFLGLNWSDTVLDHQRTAAGRGFIRTPSYAQVAEPIYARSTGRWTAYRAQLAPVLPVLAPWVERFGYAPLEVAATADP